VPAAIEIGVKYILKRKRSGGKEVSGKKLSSPHAPNIVVGVVLIVVVLVAVVEVLDPGVVRAVLRGRPVVSMAILWR
jgi:hypothetical protein